MDKRATFRGRSELDEDDFEVRGQLVDLFTVAAEFRPLSGRAMAEAGSLTDALEGTLIVRDTPRTRKLTIAERVVLNGRDYAIASVQPPDRSGWLYLKLAQTKGSA